MTAKMARVLPAVIIRALPNADNVREFRRRLVQKGYLEVSDRLDCLSSPVCLRYYPAMKIPRVIQKLIPTLTESHMPGFDEIYYRYWYRDTAEYPGTLLQHYLRHGWKEGRDPSAGFSTDRYLAANPDVKASGKNPLVHFLRHGLAEGRKGWEKELGEKPPAPRSLADAKSPKLLAPPEPR